MDDYHAFKSTSNGSGVPPPTASELLGCLGHCILFVVCFAVLAIPLLIFKALPDIMQTIILIIILLFMAAAVIYGLFFENK